MLKNGLYNIIGAVIRIGITFLTIPVIIRLMGVEEYGLWTLVSTVIGIVGLAEAGLSISTTVFLSRDLANEDVKGISQTLTVTFGGMLFLATVAAIALFIGAESLLVLFPKLKPQQGMEAVQAFKIGGIVVWSRLVQQVLVGMEQAYQRYDVMNLLNTVQICLTNIMMMAVAWLGGDTTGLMFCQAATSIGGLLAHAYVGWSLVHKQKVRPMWDGRKGIAVVRYSAMTWLTSLGSALFNQCDRLIVGAILDTRSLGIYAAITSITAQINSFSSLPVQPLLPRLSQLLTKPNSNNIQLKEQVKQALQVNGIVALGLGGTLLTLAPHAIKILVPTGNSDEYTLIFRLATIIYSLYSVNAVGYYILFSTDSVKSNLVTQLFSGGLSLSLIALTSPSLGLLGAIIGNAGYLGVWLLNIRAMQRLNIPPKIWISWIKFLIIWFLIVSLINLLFPTQNLYIIALILIVQSAFLIKHTIQENAASIQVIKRIKAKIQ